MAGNQDSLVIKTGILYFMIFCSSFGFSYLYFQRGTWHGFGWCILADVVCIVLLYLNENYRKDKLDRYCNATFLQIFQYFALLLSIGGMVAVIAYICLGVTRKDDFSVMSHYVDALTAFGASLLLLLLFIDCRKYQKALA